MRASRLPILWFTASLFLGGAGCELIAQVDRSQIGGTSTGSGGSGGSTTATSTVTATSTSSGGTGGTGGTGGAGGSGGATSTSTATSSGTGGAGGATSSSSASSTATGTGGAGGATSSSSSTSGTGGAGGSTGVCTTAAECPPPANECVTATCIGGACGTANVPTGTLTAMQTPADCLKNQCDGSGAIVTANDNTDINDDSNPCTTDACSGGVASHTPVAAGVTCGAGQVCNATGSCVGCVVATTCPGVDDECKTRTCTANVCGFSFTAAGTVTTAQTAADCQKNQCNGAGVIVPVADNTDLPVDNLQCTSDVCTAGAPTNPPTASGSACTQNGGTSCNGAGQCVQCLTASTCPGQDTDCQTRTCIAGTCGLSFAANGTVTPTGQTPANCQKNTCNGAGGVVSVPDNTDLPVDGNACTSDVCTAGVPSNPPTASGTACSQGGTVCNGGGQCVQCVTSSTCPGTDTECQTRTCVANACGFSFTATGTATAAQTAGDCKQNECNGAGAIVSASHNTDVPVDGNLCTSDVCTAGVPSNPPTTIGSPCGASLLCDGAGTCLGCNTGADCPGTDTECQTRTCVASTCGVAFTAAGTATAAQTAGDCKQNECDGSGNIVSANHNADVPSDAFQCTTDTCNAGVPTFTPVASGTACSQAGGTLCDAIGDCVQCNAATDCPGSDTDCHVRTCTSGTCGVFNTAAGNPTTTQTASNCQINQCDGAGNAVNVADNSDVPVDSNQCTGDVCTAGVPSNPNLAAGTACTQSGGTICNGNGGCIAAGATCSDGLQNGAETAIDCGGATCGACASGKACLVNSDCLSNSCSGNLCVDVLVLSQLQTRGSSGGNDEFIEIYNPTSVAVTFDNTWKVEARSAAGTLAACASAAVAQRFVGANQVIQPHHHLLYTNSSSPGYDAATVGDGTYTTGITDGSSVVLRHGGVQVDAVCFYFDAVSLSLLTGCPTAYVCEGAPVSNAPHTNSAAAGSNVDASIERLPGGALGNTQDTNVNNVDFVSSNPDTPRNLASAATP